MDTMKGVNYELSFTKYLNMRREGGRAGGGMTKTHGRKNVRYA